MPKSKEKSISLGGLLSVVLFLFFFLTEYRLRPLNPLLLNEIKILVFNSSEF